MNDHDDTISTHDTEIQGHGLTLGSHALQLTQLEGDIDAKTGALTVNMNQMQSDLDDDINMLQTDVSDNYDHFTAKDTNLQTAIDTANGDLADEVAAGAGRDQKLIEHDTQFTQVCI